MTRSTLLFLLLRPLLLPFILLTPVQELKAQTRSIINTEKSLPDPDKGLHTNINVRGSFAQGNIDLIDVSGDGVLGYRRPRDWVRLMGGSSYLSQDGSKFVDNSYIQGRYTRFFSDEQKWQSYHFAQYQSNFILILKERAIIGSGIRRSFSLGDTGHFDVGAGPMWEYERLDRKKLEEHEASIHRSWRLATAFILRYPIGSHLRILNTAYIQPRIDRWKDVRALNELSLLSSLSEKISLDLTFYYRLDSEPPETLIGRDIGMDVGFILEL